MILTVILYTNGAIKTRYYCHRKEIGAAKGEVWVIHLSKLDHVMLEPPRDYRQER
jgi:hypothetical protein